jgi:hypothetical protein
MIRRLFTIAVGVAYLVTMGGAFAADAETEAATAPAYHVERAKSAPIVDGVLDDPAWAKATPQRLEWDVDSGALWSDTRNFDGSFRALWRDGRLYLALVFEDNDVEVDERRPERSDRLELFLRHAYTQPVTHLTIPIRAKGSVEDPDVPFVAWRPDGKACELSIETTAMYQAVKELAFNLYFVDVDGGVLRERVGWVPQSSSKKTQLGVLAFDDGVGPRSKLGTTWGKVKTLY